MHPAAQDQSHPLALVAKFASFAWLFAVIVLLHAAYQSAFWDDLSNAYTARGRYAAKSATYRLEIVNAADFTPDRGLELARTPRQLVCFGFGGDSIRIS